MGGVRLSKEHGLNASISICIFCGGDKGILLLGDNYKGQAPMKAIFNYEPCEKCEKEFAKGIVFIEIKDNHPTGCAIVLDRNSDFFNHIQPESLRKDILEKGKCLVTPEDWDGIGFPRGGKNDG